MQWNSTFHCFSYILFPEILTLSSDDEEKHEKPSKKLDAESQLLANSCASELETEEESREGAAAEESDLEETRKQSAGVAGKFFWKVFIFKRILQDTD